MKLKEQVVLYCCTPSKYKKMAAVLNAKKKQMVFCFRCEGTNEVVTVGNVNVNPSAMGHYNNGGMGVDFSQRSLDLQI